MHFVVGLLQDRGVALGFPHSSAIKGTGDDRFYETMVRLAEEIWEQYLAEQARGEHAEPR